MGFLSLGICFISIFVLFLPTLRFQQVLEEDDSMRRVLHDHCRLLVILLLSLSSRVYSQTHVGLSRDGIG